MSEKKYKGILVKSAQPRFIMLDEYCKKHLSIYDLSVFTTLLFESTYSQKCSEVKMTIKYISEQSKMSERKVYDCLNHLEFDHFVLKRINYDKMKYGHTNCFLVARDYMYFKQNEQTLTTPAPKDMGVKKQYEKPVQSLTTPAPHAVPPAPHAVPPARNDILIHSSSIVNPNTTNSESIDSPAPAATSKSRKVKSKTPELLRELINVYCEVFPDNPQPHPTVISTTLDKVLSSLVTRWPELANGKPVTAAGFRVYLEALKRDAPGFSLNEYTTASGRIKKNGLDTFARWDTMVKFSEGAYS